MVLTPKLLRMLLSSGKELGALVTDGLAFSKTEMMKRTSGRIDPAVEGKRGSDTLPNDLTEKLIPAKSQEGTNQDATTTNTPTGGNNTAPLATTANTSVADAPDDDSSDGDSLVE